MSIMKSLACCVIAGVTLVGAPVALAQPTEPPSGPSAQPGVRLAARCRAELRTLAERAVANIRRAADRGCARISGLDRQGATDEQLNDAAAAARQRVNDIASAGSQAIATRAEACIARLTELGASAEVIASVTTAAENATGRIETRKTAALARIDECLTRALEPNDDGGGN
jgi:hypothetical protein